jgi:hypothetical protein
METQIPYVGRVDYNAILAEIIDRCTEEIIAFMVEELPYVWREAYLAMTPRRTNICRFWHGSFEYIYDDYATLEASGAVPFDSKAEARLVATLGRSTPHERVRDDYRLRGWIGSTETYFGRRWDKGHFIAHSIGGAVDGVEANVFIQRRDLNRGWSRTGKRFRAMERYCFLNPGTFCFNRPLYTDSSARPAFVEFGVLKINKELWVECFDNR